MPKDDVIVNTDKLEKAADKAAGLKEALIAKDEMIPKAKLDDALERIKHYETTIAALQKAADAGQLTQQQANRAGASALDQLDTVVENVSRQFAGSDKGEVRNWINFLNVAMGELSRPMVNALAGLADRLDLLDARTDITDYKDFSDEIEKERERSAQSGKYLNRREAHALVRSRHIPELLEKERSKVLAEQNNDSARSQASSTGGSDVGSTQKAGPSPTKRPAEYSKEEFSKLPLEEQEKLLESVNF